MKKTLLSLFFFITLAPLSTQNFSDDELFEMSLEELMNIRIKQTTLIDVPHTHAKGEWMFSYQYMHMDMFSHLQKGKSFSDAEVLEQYMVAPTNMNMGMHMLHLMYAPSRKLTLMSMFNYTTNSMEQLTKMGSPFSVRTKGFDDIYLSALYTLVERNKNRLVGTLGLSVPTGSIDEKGLTPMSNGMEMKLPYPMQIGTGTWDPTLAATYFTVTNTYGWGGDIRNTFRLHTNKNGYNWGNLLKFTSWYSKTWTQAFTTTLRLEMEERGNIQGKDEDLNPMMAYTADPNMRRGTLVQGELGISYRPKGSLKGTRVAVEGKIPVFQNLDGMQLATQRSLKVALVYCINHEVKTQRLFSKALGEPNSSGLFLFSVFPRRLLYFLFQSFA